MRRPGSAWGMPGRSSPAARGPRRTRSPPSRRRASRSPARRPRSGRPSPGTSRCSPVEISVSTAGSPPLRRIAICTGGGDAPGLNAVIRAAVLAAVRRGIEVFGIREGYSGILNPGGFPGGGIQPLTVESVRGITHRGGTILGTTNRGDPLHFPLTKADGSVVVMDRTADLARALREQGFDALIAVGGDGSMAIAKVLADHGMRVVGVPKTIDNDLDETV